MEPTDTDRFDALVQWNKFHGGLIHPSVEVYLDPVSKYSLRVKPPTTQGADTSTPPTLLPVDTVVSCPLSTTLSFINALAGGPIHPSQSSSQNSQPTPAFPSAFLRQTPPHVVSRFFLIQQYLLGPSSHWHPYVATLPQPDTVTSWALPAFWPEDDAAFLAATNAGVAAEEMAAAAAQEARDARRALRDAGFDAWRDYSALLYCWAFCIFASRSFRPSLVVPEAVWDGLKAEHGEFLAGCELDDFSVLMPLFDVANHDHLAVATWDAETAPGECRLLVKGREGRGYGPGEQIFNNYGLKTNSELLVAYGFMLPESLEVHNDYVHLRLRAGPVAQPADDTKKAPKPRDFLISLRPMSHPSSVVGRARRWIQGEDELIPDFAHIEDALLWEFSAAYLQAADAGTPARPEEAKVARLSAILASPTPSQYEPLVEQLREALLAKLGADYEKLKGEEYALMEALLPEEGEDVGIVLSDNQSLAMAYRRQCEKVLQAAMVAMDPDIRFEEGDEE